MMNISTSLRKNVLLLFLTLLGHSGTTYAWQAEKLPFSTNAEQLTIWNGAEYVPFFMKGMNLGISVPGTFPGEMAATEQQYARWFRQIKDAGFNCIRLYTLHYPRFFKALDDFNRANPRNPLLFLQGVWLNEELPGYQNDLYFLSEAFRQEIEENVDCVHGKRVIPERFGKASGTYSRDVSQWCLGYIIGREIHPIEVKTTNDLHTGDSQFSGKHFSINNASASEAWATRMLDHTVAYELAKYATQRPVSCSSWPTLDPLRHLVAGSAGEDAESVDFSKIKRVNAPAGLFISYHAYPYYPSFVSNQPSYQSFSDQYGPNSYLGYLKELRSHYPGLPVIIAEYGVPSSWETAQFASSGMNHGGFDEYQQGQTNVRMLQTIQSSGCGGGILFAWIDEWFKRTWITDPVDYTPNDRVLWHNLASAEQNFGLVKYEKKPKAASLLLQNAANADISHIKAKAGYALLELEIGLKKPLALPGEMWLAIDTYDANLGESVLPSGKTMPIRAEFALHITNYSAKLYVTEAYDLFGIWHNVSTPQQLYRSTATDGAPWEIVRVRNNYPYSEVQYVGDLQVNIGLQPSSSKDGVTVADDKISVRLPWSYLNVVAPNRLKVLHDDRNTPEKEEAALDGMAFALLYKNEWHRTANRFRWDTWSQVADTSVVEVFKKSYYVMKDRLTDFNTPAVARLDSFHFAGPFFPATVRASDGLLKNDFDLDGDLLTSLVVENPRHGKVYLQNDGSFEYIPDGGFTGLDSFQYSIYDGFSLSKPNFVKLLVKSNNSDGGLSPFTFAQIIVYPNPSENVLNVRSKHEIESLQVFDLQGKLLDSALPNQSDHQIDVSRYLAGMYVLVARIGGQIISEKFVKR